MSWLLTAYSDKRTYASLGYLLLGLPLGVIGIVVMITGFSLGIGLLITWLGIPVIVATLAFVGAYANLERRLAWSWLEAPMPRLSSASRPRAENGLWERLQRSIRSPRTWREVIFVTLRLPMGAAGFSVAVTVVALMLGGFAQPIVVALDVNAQIGDWVIDTIPESLAFLPVSLVFLLVGPRILLGYGSASARFATAMLGHVETSEMKIAVAGTLAQQGQAGALDIARGLELRLGRGPFVTLSRVQATLIALEARGLVRATTGDSGTRYALTE